MDNSSARPYTQMESLLKRIFCLSVIFIQQCTHMQNIEKLFLDLVKIPSPSGNEDGMRAYVTRILLSYTKSIYIDTVGNIYAHFAGSGEPLLLCARSEERRGGKEGRSR